MIKKQEMFDRTILKNSESIKTIDEEIKSIAIEKTKRDNTKQEVDAAISQLNDEIRRLKLVQEKDKSRKEVHVVNEKAVGTKCRYFNSGYCKYKNNCKFIHPSEICKDSECRKDKCLKRHPKACKWYRGESGCKRGNTCEYSHDTLVCSDDAKTEFKCVSCKHEWTETKFVVKHLINGMEVYFCLNCDDWVKQKERVFDQGWSLMDQDGNLNYHV